MLPDHLMPFLMQYIKDMRNPAIEIMIHPVCQAYLKQHRCDLNDLSRLSDEDLIKFKELFMQHRVSVAHKWTGPGIELLYDYVIDILSKRVPIENVQVRVEQIINRVRLVPVPPNLYFEDFFETVTVEKDGKYE